MVVTQTGINNTYIMHSRPTQHFLNFFVISRLCGSSEFFQIVKNLQKNFPVYLLKKKMCVWMDPHRSSLCWSRANRIVKTFCLVWCIPLIDLRLLNHPCIPRINLPWSWCVIFLVYCWMQFANNGWGFLHLCSTQLLAYSFFVVSLIVVLG